MDIQKNIDRVLFEIGQAEQEKFDAVFRLEKLNGELDFYYDLGFGAKADVLAEIEGSRS